MRDDAAREQVVTWRELEQVCWQSGYVAGAAHERAATLARVVAWLRAAAGSPGFVLVAAGLADELEHGALDATAAAAR